LHAPKRILGFRAASDPAPSRAPQPRLASGSPSPRPVSPRVCSQAGDRGSRSPGAFAFRLQPSRNARRSACLHQSRGCSGLWDGFTPARRVGVMRCPISVRLLEPGVMSSYQRARSCRQYVWPVLSLPLSARMTPAGECHRRHQAGAMGRPLCLVPAQGKV
jgi:hypothetical protein